MSDTDTTVVEVETVAGAPKAKKAPKAKAKAALAKKAAKKKTVKAKESEVVHEYGAEKSKDLPWCDKKVKLFKALKALRAMTAVDAVGSKDLAEKSGLSGRDVRHYSYHAAAADLVKYVEKEGVAGWAFYLTKKGAGLDPSAEFNKQEAAKKE